MEQNICPECSRKSPKDQRFCRHCGHEFYDRKQDRDSDVPISDVRIGDYLIEDIRICVGKNSDVYINKFSKLVYGDKKRSFNWSAALFSHAWSGYRLMTGGTAFYLGLGLLIEYLGALLVILLYLMTGSMGILVCSTIALIVGYTMLAGFLGDWLYWRHIKRKLNSCGCRNRPAFRNDYKAKQLSDCGGTTVGGIVAACVIRGILKFILTKVQF